MRCCSASNSRTFSMAITAWSAKMVTSSMCLSLNGRLRFESDDNYPDRRSFARSGTPRYGTKFTEGCFASTKSVLVDRPERRRYEPLSPVEQNSPKDRSLASVKSDRIMQYCVIFRREAVGSRRMRRHAPLLRWIVGACLPRRAAPPIDQRVEHGLQIEGRAADDLEHVGGGGLLLQQFCAAR